MSCHSCGHPSFVHIQPDTVEKSAVSCAIYWMMQGLLPCKIIFWVWEAYLCQPTDTSHCEVICWEFALPNVGLVIAQLLDLWRSGFKKVFKITSKCFLSCECALFSGTWATHFPLMVEGQAVPPGSDVARCPAIFPSLGLKLFACWALRWSRDAPDPARQWNWPGPHSSQWLGRQRPQPDRHLWVHLFFPNKQEGSPHSWNWVCKYQTSKGKDLRQDTHHRTLFICFFKAGFCFSLQRLRGNGNLNASMTSQHYEEQSVSDVP